jgi:hypothetical protein
MARAAVNAPKRSQIETANSDLSPQSCRHQPLVESVERKGMPWMGGFHGVATFAVALAATGFADGAATAVA